MQLSGAHEKSLVLTIMLITWEIWKQHNVGLPTKIHITDGLNLENKICGEGMGYCRQKDVLIFPRFFPSCSPSTLI